MKKLKISALLIVLGAGLAFAQGPRGEHPKGDRMKHNIEKLDSIVDLTDDQKVKITALQEDLKVKMKEARSSQDREAMKTLHQKHKADIEAILTPEQIEKMKAAKEAHRADMKEMRGELKKYRDEQITPALKLKRAEFENTLTEEEKATITSLRTEFKGERANKDSAHRGSKHRMDLEQRKLRKEKIEANLGPIVTAHKAELDRIEADLKPLRETWEADMKQIKEKHKASCEGSCKGHKGKGKKGKGHKGHKKGDHADKSTMKQYKFLLMKFE